MFIKFQYLGAIVTLVSLHPVAHFLQEGDQFFKKPVRKGILLQIVSLGSATSSAQSCDPTIEQLLSEFALVFATPIDLPPCRGHEHQILLKDGTDPICQRLYRYPHFPKTEIEKIVAESLEVGSIRPSQSPFSSPELLVRKVDGSWRMCMDYRALNQANIKDKFPIPVVVSLLVPLSFLSRI